MKTGIRVFARIPAGLGHVSGTQMGNPGQELVGFLSELRERSVDLYLHQQGLDTSTPSGRAMYQMLGVFAEFERAIIIERIKAGMARAKAQGKQLSRPMTPEEIQERIKELRAKGHSLRWIAEELGVGKSTAEKYAKGKAPKKPGANVESAIS